MTVDLNVLQRKHDFLSYTERTYAHRMSNYLIPVLRQADAYTITPHRFQKVKRLLAVVAHQVEPDNL